jgi:hypothetical protein
LHHDPAEDHELRVDGVEDAVVGKVEAVGDFGGEPCCCDVVVSTVRILWG